MKRIKLVVFVVLFGFICSFSLLPIKAAYFDHENWDNNCNVSKIIEKRKFNILFPLNEPTEIDSDPRFIDVCDTMELFQDEEGLFEFYTFCHSESENKFFSITVKLEKENNMLRHLTYYIDDDKFYSIDLYGCNNVTVLQADEINLLERFNTKESFVFGTVTEQEGENICRANFTPAQTVYLFTLLYGIEVKEVNDVDTYVITKNLNPLSLEEIKNSFQLIDETDGKLSKDYIKVINTNYNDEESIKAGVYDIDLLYFDRSRNSVKQTIKVYVHDVIPPKIVVKKNPTFDADDNITKADLLDIFEVSDETSDVKLEIEKDNYTPNKNKAGLYEVSAIAKDAAGNISRAVVNVKVIDKIAPKIWLKDEIICVKNTEVLTKEDILKTVGLYDNIDKKEDCKFNVESLYFTYPSVIGEYQVVIEAYDTSNNMGKTVGYIKVYDGDYPQLEGKDNVITVDKGVVLTKEQVIDLLIKSGQIENNNNNVLNLESNYFLEDSPIGEYELKVLMNDGSKKNIKLKVIDSNYNYDSKKDIEKNNNSFIIISILIATVLVIITGLGIFVYKKKH